MFKLFKTVAPTVLLTPVLATTDLMDQQLAALVSNSSLRAFSGQIAKAIPKLDEFGCWCYFYDNVGRGKGQPVDEVDAFCKTLHEGYECAIRDSEDEGLACTPWDVPYNPSNTAEKMFDSCVANNPDDMCAARACAVEGNFVEGLFAYLIGGSQINYADYSHAEGFDPATDAGCPVKKGTAGASSAKACCGNYPSRFPFKTLDGERACCGARTYQTAILNCCASNKVKASC